MKLTIKNIAERYGGTGIDGGVIHFADVNGSVFKVGMGYDAHNPYSNLDFVELWRVHEKKDVIPNYIFSNYRYACVKFSVQHHIICPLEAFVIGMEGI